MARIRKGKMEMSNRTNIEKYPHEEGAKCNCGLDHGSEEKNVAPSVVSGEEAAKVVKVSSGIDLRAVQDYLSLEEHDKQYHKGGYKEGDVCKVREAINKSDAPDKMMGKSKDMGNIAVAREDIGDFIGKTLGGRTEFKPVRGKVGFEVKPSSSMEGWKMDMLGERLGKKIEDLGYVGRAHVVRSSDGGAYFEGVVEKMSPERLLARTQSEKPSKVKMEVYNDIAKVDGKNYYDYREAEAAWKAALKKYGSQVKLGQK